MGDCGLWVRTVGNDGNGPFTRLLGKGEATSERDGEREVPTIKSRPGCGCAVTNNGPLSFLEPPHEPLYITLLPFFPQTPPLQFNPILSFTSLLSTRSISGFRWLHR